MPKIYLVRHGKALSGWGEDRDPGLSDLGRIQATSMADHMAGLGPMPVVCSPMARARETAEPLCRIWKIKPGIENSVSEIPMPDPEKEDRTRWLTHVMSRKWSNLDHNLSVWRKAVIETLRNLSQDTVVVSHFIAINAAVGEALGDDRVVVFRPDNASVTVIASEMHRLRLFELGAQDDTSVL